MKEHLLSEEDISNLSAKDIAELINGMLVNYIQPSDNPRMKEIWNIKKGAIQSLIDLVAIENEYKETEYFPEDW